MALSKRLEDLRDKIHQYPILDILQYYATIQGLESTGRGYKGFCNLQQGKDKDFHIDKAGNYWTCFKCMCTNGEAVKQDAISFVMQYLNVSFPEAVETIAEDFGIQSEYEKVAYKNVKGPRKRPKAAPLKKIEDIQEKVSPKRSIKELHVVYRLFLQAAGLTKEHQRMLMTERYLTRQQIKENCYASYPTRSVLPSFFALLEANDIPKDFLLGVPGFYVNTKTNQITFDESKDYKGNYKTGVLIPITDAEGYIQCIQTRHDVVETRADGRKGLRYTYFSSSRYTDEAKGGIWGCGPGAPIGVVYPKDLQTKFVFITEGRFKAEILSRTMGAIVIYVQGVSSVKNIEEIVANILETLNGCNLLGQNLVMAFDADSFKYTVYMALKKVSALLNESFKQIKLQYLLWNPNHGKGIDDLINGNPNNFRSYFKLSEKSEWDRKYLDAYCESILQTFEFQEDEFLACYQKTPAEIIRLYVKWRVAVTSEEREQIRSTHHEFFNQLKVSESEKEITYAIQEQISSLLFSDFN